MDLRILDSVGEGRHLRTEFALSTVATVPRVIALCRGVYTQEIYILRKEMGLGFVTT